MLNFMFGSNDDDGVDEDVINRTKVTLKLEMFGGWIYIDSLIDKVVLNETELRYDGTPRNILEYAIIKRPGELITIDDLKKAGIATKRDLRQVAINAGLKNITRDLFIPVCTRDKIKIIRKRRLDTRLAMAVIENLRHQ